MRKTFLFIPMLFLFGCVSYMPVEIGSYESFSYTPPSGQTESDISKARKYALSVSQKYKTTVMQTYKDNNAYDSWILNLVTIGIGAALADADSGILEAGAVILGYQSARKTYQSIPFQMQLYTNAITSALCIYDSSARLESGYENLSKIRTIITTLNVSLNVLEINPTLSNQLITTELKDLGSYDAIKPKLTRALELANQAYDSLETSGAAVVGSIQKIDITILKRFNGQLPDINEITNQIRLQVTENITLEEKGGVDALSTEGISNVSLLGRATTPPYSHLVDPLGKALGAINELSTLRVERYISDSNLVGACSASI